MRLPILCLALCQLSDSIICNQKTTYECPCDECSDYTQSHDSVDWLHIHLVDCPPPSLNETTFRKKIANWINEECGAALDCHLNRGLDVKNIVIGEFSCPRKEIAILALRNSSAPIMLENVIGASTVGLVLQSREHLLSFLLHSELREVAIERRIGGVSHLRKRSLKFWMILFTILFALFLIALGLCVYFSQIYINWRRIVKGKWQSKEYSKVPNVRYSVDEIASQGHI